MYAVASGALYSLAAHAPWGTVYVVPASGLDRWVPQVDAAVPVYLTYFLLLPALLLSGAARQRLLPVMFAACVTTGLCLLWHLCVPTRVLLTPPGDDTLGWLAWLRSLDSPFAALPSGHVALPVSLALTLANRRSSGAAAYAIWSAALAWATIATGQHVMWDVLAGALLGTGVARLTLALETRQVDLRSFGALLGEWLVISLAVVAAVRLDSAWIWCGSFLVIATRQHALFMLYHDAVHGLLARRPGVNDFLINAFAGVPLLLPVQIYRALHLAHHRLLGTDADPERRYLYAGQRWRYQPLSTARLCRQLLGDLLLVNGIRTIRAWHSAERMPAVHRLRSVWIPAAVWSGLVLGFCAASPRMTLQVIALLWLAPLLTLTNLLQKLRSFAEHSGGPGVTPGWDGWTYSWRPGWIGRLAIWPYNINLHREHHLNAQIPWHRLPQVIVPDAPQLSGRALRALLMA